MNHPLTQPEIIAALEANAASIAEFFSSLPEALVLEGDSDHWGPAHHLEHLTQTSISVERALRSKELPLHPHSRSRTYAEVRDAAAASLALASKDRLLEMGRTVVISAGAHWPEIVNAFTTASANLRAAAATWTEANLDRYALAHPIMGTLTVREMLLFCVVHERHHWKSVRRRLEAT